MGKILEQDIPKKWLKDIKEKSLDETVTILSTQRTEFSEHRTNLSNARSHMANERTHLSYLRTSLALLTFGITMNRFSIFLRENKIQTKEHSILYETQYVGFGMVILAVVILSWALYHYRKVSREINAFRYTPPGNAVHAFTILILILGGFSAIWMIINES